MKKVKTPALVLVFLLCLCGFMVGCGEPDSETDSVTGIKLIKYNDTEITDDLVTVNLSDSPLTFTADVKVTGKASKDYTLASSNTEVATVSGKTVTLVAEGQTTITAVAVGDSTKTHAVTLEVADDTEIETGSVISIKLKYNDDEIADDLLTVIFVSGNQLTFTADVEVTGNASTDFTLTSSTPRVAAVSEKTVTLGSAGRTTITATAVDDSTKTHAVTLVAGYGVSVSGGTADVIAALVNQTVTLTPEIPTGKVFIDWTIEPSTVQMISANSFSMPSRNVTVTGNFGDDKPYYVTNNFGEDSSTEFLVQWHSYSDAVTQTLQLAAEAGSFENATAIPVTGELFQASNPVGAFAPRKVFKARVTGLTPNTAYKYRVGYAGAWSDEFHHLTSGGTADDFSFTIVSDPQSEAHTAMSNTLRAADAFDQNHKFYLMGGDVVDAIGGRPKEIVSYANAANEFNIKRPIAATQGNHDTQYVDGGYRFGEAEVFNVFVTFPDNGGDTQAEKAKRSQCYYFYYNKVLFIMLNTMATSVGSITTDPDYTRQADWLKEVLEKDRAGGLSRYTIVLTHIGPFGGRDNTRWPTAVSRKAFTKIFTDYNVDIVFSGHDHVYGRSDPIKITVEMSGKNDDTDYLSMEGAGNFNAVPNGTVFSIVSATGPKFYQISQSDKWVPRFFPVRADNQKDNDPGVFINVKVTADKLKVTAMKLPTGGTGPGTVLDSYEVKIK